MPSAPLRDSQSIAFFSAAEVNPLSARWQGSQGAVRGGAFTSSAWGRRTYTRGSQRRRRWRKTRPCAAWRLRAGGPRPPRPGHNCFRGWRVVNLCTGGRAACVGGNKKPTTAVRPAQREASLPHRALLPRQRVLARRLQRGFEETRQMPRSFRRKKERGKEETKLLRSMISLGAWWPSTPRDLPSSKGPFNCWRAVNRPGGAGAGGRLPYWRRPPPTRAEGAAPGSGAALRSAGAEEKRPCQSAPAKRAQRRRRSHRSYSACGISTACKFA